MRVDVSLTIGGSAIGFGDQAEPLRSEQHDVEPPVVQFLDPDQFAEAADLVQTGWVGVVGRLDHRDPSRPGHRVLDHRAIAFLEDVQRQMRAREQDRPA